jgi:Flp pilus assembly pilin Flp
MLKLIRKFARDEGGAILNSAELVFLATILAIGILPGVTMLRDAIVKEFAQMAAAVNPQPPQGPPFGHAFGHNHVHGPNGDQIATAADVIANQ